MPKQPLCRRRPRRSLARLAANRFGCVLDSLALVRFGRPEFANLRRNRTEQLTVGALEGNGHQFLDFGGDPGRQLIDDRMRIAERQVDLIGLGFRAVADAVYLEHAGKALADALDHVGDQLAHETVDRALFTGIAGPLDDDFRVLDLGGEAGMKLELELALGALDLKRAAGDRSLDGLIEMNRDRKSTRLNSSH